MIVSVLYKIGAGQKFDLDYYIGTHIPLVKSKWGPLGLADVKVLQATGTATGDAAPFDIVALLDFASMDAFKAAGKAHGREVMGDVVNFTDSTPVVQFNDVIG